MFADVQARPTEAGKTIPSVGFERQTILAAGFIPAAPAGTVMVLSMLGTRRHQAFTIT